MPAFWARATFSAFSSAVWVVHTSLKKEGADSILQCRRLIPASFRLVSLFLGEESEGAAYFDAYFLADTTD